MPVLGPPAVVSVSNAAVPWLTDGILRKKHFKGHNRSQAVPGPESLMETLQGNPGRSRLHPSAGMDPHAPLKLSKKFLFTHNFIVCGSGYDSQGPETCQHLPGLAGPREDRRLWPGYRPSC